MKKVLNVFLIILLMFIAGCASNVNKKVYTYELMYDPNDIYTNIDSFKLYNIKIRIISDEVDGYIDVRPEMLSEEDLASLNSVGTHQVTIKYRDLSETITITLTSDSTFYSLVYDANDLIKDVKEFNLSDIKIHEMSSEKDRYIDVTVDMISPEDALKLKKAGTHQITIVYETFAQTITVVLTQSSGGDYNANDFDLDGYYTSAIGLEGQELKLALRSIISVTTKTEKYDDLRQDLQKTDASLTESGKIVDFYSHKLMNATWDSGATWNREHVWPRSKAWYQYTGAGADIHAVRPADSKDNSSRGNKAFGIGGDYFEPDDCSKGDVARIVFYMLVRYSETDVNYPVTNVAQSMELLLQWNQKDPVDDLERQRNRVAYTIQGNRNPFIDYSDYAYYIWDVSYLSFNVEDVENSFVCTIKCFDFYYDNRI